MQQYNRPTSFGTFNETFKQLGHSASWRNLKVDLMTLQDANLVEIYYTTYNNRKVKRYRLTTIAKIVLMNLETALRKERFDK